MRASTPPRPLVFLRRLAAPLLAALLALVGCHELRSPAPEPGPIVLITVDALRADIVGGLAGAAPGSEQLTPHLAALAREADWAGPAVAASSATVPAIASLLTGLAPWQHQALYPEQARLAAPLRTLAEALGEQGYDTTAYVSGYWYPRGFGYDQGFDLYRGLNRGGRAAGHLASLEPGRSFVWIHLDAPKPPYRIRERLRAQLGPLPGGLPAELDALQLELYRNPSNELPAARRERFFALYRAEAALLDARIGRLLRALRQSGRWDETLLVVVSAHGEEIGEHGQMGHANNLLPPTLRVPLLVKLPAGARGIELEPGEAVAARRIFATLVEHAGGAAGPAVARSLFRRSPVGVLSELYRSEGCNRFSLVDGEHQLLREVCFGVEDEYYRARWQLAGATLTRPLVEPPEVVFDRLQRSFDRTPPFTGGAAAEVRERVIEWGPEGAREVSDAALEASLSAALERRWRAFQPGEETPPEALLRLAGPPLER